ncbi:hypothetical protein MCUN1_001349 [Malassezia cuniculi]|uniref:ABC1 atypical kinase-like domain-containing protein n=1 Tax=Malassezia cuniculi TaxID=948313 RepID=A0AAF0EXM8_9BASI|nr:hypothetical protein MCUN1_001349 [Malassezia cuniculi]
MVVFVSVRPGGIAAIATAVAAAAAATAYALKKNRVEETLYGTEIDEEPPIPPEPPANEHPVLRILVTYVVEPLGILKRFIYLALLFSPVILLAPIVFFGKRRTYMRRGVKICGERAGALWWFDLLVAQMERAGPTFVKLGQWAGSRHDLFPDELCARFSKLHSSNKPHSMKHTRRVIERVFNRQFEEVFTEFDTTPLGIGAVGQVYRGKLRKESFDVEDMPTDVAIKVLHPKVHKTIRRDLEIMRIFAAVINALPGMQWVSLPEEVSIFSDLMLSQLNLRHEALNLERFRHNFKDSGGVISFPKPFMPFCTTDLLIEQHIDAVPLHFFIDYGSEAYDRRIAALGLNAFLKMLLLDNFTHADLHTGNIMVRFYKPSEGGVIRRTLKRIVRRVDPDAVARDAPRTANDSVVDGILATTKDEDAWNAELEDLDEQGYCPELIFLDAGLVSELSTTNRANFIDLFAALTSFDGHRAGSLMIDRCRTPQLVVDADGFIAKIERIINNLRGETFSLSKMQIGEVLGEVLSAVREHHVKMEPDFVNTVLSCVILEGIGRRLDPDLDLFRSSIPILLSLGCRLSIGDAESSHLMGMAKVWLYAEARSLLASFTTSRAVVDAFVRYGWISE